eukprot:756372-Hanusia_phi.AAC.1
MLFRHSLSRLFLRHDRHGAIHRDDWSFGGSCPLLHRKVAKFAFNSSLYRISSLVPVRWISLPLIHGRVCSAKGDVEKALDAYFESGGSKFEFPSALICEDCAQEKLEMFLTSQNQRLEVESPSREIAQDAPVEPKNHKATGSPDRTGRGVTFLQVTVWKGNAFQLNDGPVRYPWESVSVGRLIMHQVSR